MINFWDLYSIVYDSLPSYFRPYKLLMEEVTEEVAKCCAKGKLLDAGCGTGNFAIALARRGYDIVGIDSAPGMLRRFESKKKKDSICGITLIQSDLEQHLAFPDNYFDVLICIHVLYSMRNPGNVLKEYHRILRPLGHFILCEPQRQLRLGPIIRETKSKEGWKSAANIIFRLFILGCFNLVLGKKQSKGVYHYWNESEMRRSLDKTGFKVMSLRQTYTNDIDILVSSLKCPLRMNRAISIDHTTEEAIISSI